MFPSVLLFNLPIFVKGRKELELYWALNLLQSSNPFEMTKLKLDFDDDFDEPYTLLAIHCSEEEYKLAYLLNLHLGIKLTRRPVDLDFSIKGALVAFPLYDYEDTDQYTSYYLVSNCSQLEGANSPEGLFATASDTFYLIPELKKVDYFLKIYSDFESVPLKKIIAGLNEIKQVISAYTVAVDTIKSRNNLIFD